MFSLISISVDSILHKLSYPINNKAKAGFGANSSLYAGAIIASGANNMEVQDSSPSEDELAKDAMEAVGVLEPKEQIEEAPHSSGDGNPGTENDLPVGVKQRLGRQEKRHKREMAEMRAQMQALQQNMTQPTEDSSHQGGQFNEPNGNVNDQIHQAVAAALSAQEEQKRRAREDEEKAHVYKRYDALQQDLDKASDKYDDFDDVVRAQEAPFTNAMRDAALFLTNPAETLYKLGKNKEELKRIASLHPVDQAKEMVKLSHALMMGKEGSDSPNNPQSRPIGQVKSYPVNHASVSDKTPVGEIRRRMKAGEWKGQR